MLAKIGFDRRFGPQVLLSPVRHHLSVDDIANAGKQRDHEEFLQHVGLRGLEPLASSLSGKRSNRLSYRPVFARQGYKVSGAGHQSARVGRIGWSDVVAEDNLDAAGDPDGGVVDVCEHRGEGRDQHDLD